MKKNFSSQKNKGFSLLEIVIASAILLLVTVTVFSSFATALSVSSKNTASLQAAFLLEEGHEALRNMRDWGYSTYIGSLSNNTPYRLAWESNHWMATTSTALIDGKFDRTFTLNTVNRDASHNIVASGGSVDANSKKVTVSVSWRSGNSTTTRTMESYVSNIFSN